MQSLTQLSCCYFVLVNFRSRCPGSQTGRSTKNETMCNARVLDIRAKVYNHYNKKSIRFKDSLELLLRSRQRLFSSPYGVKVGDCLNGRRTTSICRSLISFLQESTSRLNCNHLIIYHYLGDITCETSTLYSAPPRHVTRVQRLFWLPYQKPEQLTHSPTLALFVLERNRHASVL
jgi:hypothetical protein